MAKSKLQRLGKEEVDRRIKIKRKKRLFKNIKSKVNSLSIYSNIAMFLYITHMHGILIPFLTNIYVQVAPIVENLIKQLPL